MSRLARLRDLYFPSLEEEAEELAQVEQAQAQIQGKILGFLTCEYIEEYKAWLRAQVRNSQPTPGEHATMLYSSGMRDGFQAVLDHMDDLEASCRERLNG